ncbi:hypothetical protein ABBQ32_007942 [Trebouxia sp. C0010 RCD-2024]
MYARPTSHSGALGPGCAGPSLAVPNPASIHEQHGYTPQVPTCGAAPFVVDPSALASSNGEPTKHTQTPFVTGTSVFGLTFSGGVMIASDTLGCYGSTKRYKSFERLKQINSKTVIGAGGELSDFQYTMTLLEELMLEDFCLDDDIEMSPKEVFAYLNRVVYNRRTKMDPLWNSLVIGGLQQGKDGQLQPFLGTIGMIGTHYEDAHIATGYGNMLARPLFREKHKPDMSEDDAMQLMKEALKVCYYRDKNSINKFQVAKVTADGVDICEPFALETNWDFKAFVNPSKHAVGGW